jgi:ABC-type antimicrobial peptide transport system permease subunit
MGSLLFETEPADPLTFLAVAGVLAVVGLASVLLPARRAARVEPLRALRAD